MKPEVSRVMLLSVYDQGAAQFSTSLPDFKGLEKQNVNIRITNLKPPKRVTVIGMVSNKETIGLSCST